MDLRKLKTLLDLFEASNLQEMEFCEGEEKVRLTKPAPQAVAVAPQPIVAAPASAPPKEAVADADEEVVSGERVTSPMVGTFYRSSSPDKPPFVQKGDKVEKGQIICIIEAMKLMNEIPATVSGTVKEVLVDNAQPVAYGTPLFIIE